jgi:hypothetical protein
MNVRRVKLDVDWAIGGPSIAMVAEAIEEVDGVQAATITITEIDLETVGTDITVEGENVDLDALSSAIQQAGAVVHSVDELAFGDRIVAFTPRHR